MLDAKKYLVSKKKIKKQIHNLEHQLASSREQRRKQETRRKIQLGGLIVKAELDKLDRAALYGALLELKQMIEKDENLIKKFAENGKIFFKDD